jgi:hypothetical protein
MQAVIEIHGTVIWKDTVYAITSIAASADGSTELEAYRLVDQARFPGGEASQKNGWLHGQIVQHECKEYRLAGPPSVFKSPERPALRQKSPVFAETRVA